MPCSCPRQPRRPFSSLGGWRAGRGGDPAANFPAFVPFIPKVTILPFISPSQISAPLPFPREVLLGSFLLSPPPEPPTWGTPRARPPPHPTVVCGHPAACRPLGDLLAHRGHRSRRLHRSAPPDPPSSSSAPLLPTTQISPCPPDAGRRLGGGFPRDWGLMETPSPTASLAASRHHGCGQGPPGPPVTWSPWGASLGGFCGAQEETGGTEPPRGGWAGGRTDRQTPSWVWRGAQGGFVPVKSSRTRGCSSPGPLKNPGQNSPRGLGGVLGGLTRPGPAWETLTRREGSSCKIPHLLQREERTAAGTRPRVTAR